MSRSLASLLIPLAVLVVLASALIAIRSEFASAALLIALLIADVFHHFKLN